MSKRKIKISKAHIQFLEQLVAHIIAVNVRPRSDEDLINLLKDLSVIVVDENL